MKKKRRNIVEDGLTKEELAEIKERLGIDENYKPVKQEDVTEQDFYNDLENRPFDTLPKQVQIHEIMVQEGITDGHPMYDEMIDSIQDIVNYEIDRSIAEGGDGDFYIPITREEYIVWLYMLCECLQDKPAIPGEYRHLIKLFE
ncbi:hypothetical protein H7K05_26200 [Priestia aryabhattai]|uniref:hypothetical protein n=1 Tax=Priestia aryabhattai TaxID=412384 RepID=UPI001C8D7CE3|nr:hypothetical protein [Priestia aryabhattai]MBY0008802.1 hypothetical protein [Priestia aryabhattai]MBY0049990.1 hypothetical protein [Priestia aryabhattai]